jgi:hypothetical protein
MNSPSLFIPPMSHASCTALSSLSNGLKRSWPGPTRHFSPNGSVTDIPTLKKSQRRKGRHPLRRRSQLPPGPHALPNLGAPRLSATNPDHWATKHLENIWHNRTLLCSVPLPLPERFQCRYLHRLSRTDTAQLLSPQNLSDPRQCVLPQGQKRLGLVLTTSQVYGGLQPSCLFSKTQRAGANLASYPFTWYPRSVFCNPRRASFGIDFNFSQYSKKFPTSARLLTPLSITLMSRYLCNSI